MNAVDQKRLEGMIGEVEQRIVQHREGVARCQQNIAQLKDTQKMYDKHLREDIRALMRLEKLRG